ncbi:MAG: hypothetical protein COB77_04235, partial [Gammaproteobacteria bacterium]
MFLSLIPIKRLKVKKPISATIDEELIEWIEKEIKDTTVIYELEGKLINGKEYDIKISADGTILKIELDD